MKMVLYLLMSQAEKVLMLISTLRTIHNYLLLYLLLFAIRFWQWIISRKAALSKMKEITIKEMSLHPLSLILLVIVTFYALNTLYVVFFRLRSVPGPWWAPYSRLWLWRTLTSGESAYRYQRIGERYGEKFLFVTSNDYRNFGQRPCDMYSYTL